MLAAVAVAMVATGLPAWILLVGVSLAFAAGGIAMGTFDASLFAAIPSRIVGLLENDLLQALPLYVFMGVLINRTALADTLFRAARAAFARTGRAETLGGLFLGVLLAPMSGSVGASVAMLSRTLYPRLKSAGVPESRSLALVCVSSTLGVVVPPSLVLILLGDAMLRAHTEAQHLVATNARIVNTQDVFHAALVPAGLFLALCIAVAAWQGRGAPSSKAGHCSRGDWITAIAAASFIVTLLAGVALGYLYAVEAAATGGMALMVHALATRAVTRETLAAMLRETMAITGALFALLVAATVFTLVQRAFGTDRWLASTFASMGGQKVAVLALGLGAVAACALVLDAFEMIFVVIPLIAPALLVAAPDAPWVSVMILLILQASFLIPPFGYAVLMARSRTGSHVATSLLVRALLPFVVAQLLVLVLVAAFPAIIWRESPTLTPRTEQPRMSEEKMRELLDQQLRDDEK
ncbi:MAG TPA: TRAP transporter large permease subunit [Usitatibacter sp.]